MLICSCAVISDHDIELALLEIMIEENAPMPTPGVVWRHLQKKMNCCGCAPHAIAVIYRKLQELEEKGLVCPCACATALDRRARVEARKSQPPGSAKAPAAARYSAEPDGGTSHPEGAMQPLMDMSGVAAKSEDL